MTTEDLNQLFDGDGWHIIKPTEQKEISYKQLKKEIEAEYERFFKRIDLRGDWIDSFRDNEEIE